jgi:predicted ATP-grasp superfamily ATP-dependent carboligase
VHKEKGGFPNPVVVIGTGLTALGIARTLGRHGIDVFSVSDKRDPVVFSKYCKRSFTADKTRYDKGILKRLLVEIGKSFSKRAVVYPTSDLDAVNLAELKDELSDDYFFVVGAKEAVKTLVNKKKFYKVLSKVGIAHPQTYFPESVKEAHSLETKLDYPIFIRPAITQLFSFAFPKNGKGFLAYSPKELVDYYRLAKQHGIDIMFQEIVPGPPTNSYQLEGYYNVKHNPLCLFARQRLRIWPPDFGNTTLCVSIPIVNLSEEKNSINKLISAIGHNGFASAEFKKDERDGAMKLLEINARPWWHLWLSQSCGVDIALASYLDAIGEAGTIAPREHYELGVKSVYLFGDLMAAADMLRNKKLRFHSWASSLRGVRCDAFLSRDDLSPFIIACLKTGSELFNLTSRKHSRNRQRQFNDYHHND